MKLRIVMLAFLLAAVSAAQTVVTATQFNFTYKVQTIAGAIPTSLTCVVGPAAACKLQIKPVATSSDPTYGAPFLCAIDLTATGQTITIEDGQPTPIAWIVAGGTLPASGSAPTGFEWHADNDGACRPFIGGLYIQAGGAGVTGRLLIKYNL